MMRLSLCCHVLWMILLAGGLPADVRAATAGEQGSLEQRPATANHRDLLKTYTQALALAEANYADSVDSGIAIRGSISGMLRCLDPHSSFYDETEFRQFQEYQEGKLSGLGLELGLIDGDVVVLRCTPGSPAFASGIRPGDLLLKIDGTDAKGCTEKQLSEKIRSQAAAKINLAIRSLETQQVRSFSLAPTEVPVQSIPLCFQVRPRVGYLQMRGFAATTEKELDEALKRLGSDLDGFILDLRDNPGGSVEAAIAAADRFLVKDQAILVTQGRIPGSSFRRVAQHGSRYPILPLVVLINKGSASAAEILAGAIQDHDRGLILGETSFGKGLVQTLYPLGSGAGLSLTTAKWYTPNGRLIQRSYKGLSLFEYFETSRRKTAHPQESKLTDGGRRVYEGGGIAPDLSSKAPDPTPFQTTLLFRHLTFGFIRQMKLTHPEWLLVGQVNGKMIEEFSKYLSARHVRFSAQDLRANLPFIRRQIRQQVALLSEKYEECDRIRIEEDPQVLLAVESLPQARALLQTAKKLAALDSCPTPLPASWLPPKVSPSPPGCIR